MQSFPGLGDNNTALPPDTSGAAGPNHLMITLNSQVQVQTLAQNCRIFFQNPDDQLLDTVGEVGSSRRERGEAGGAGCGARDRPEPGGEALEVDRGRGRHVLQAWTSPLGVEGSLTNPITPGG